MRSRAWAARTARPGPPTRRRSPSSGRTRPAPPTPSATGTQIAEGVSAARGLSLVDDARLFALLNIATADALIACWDAKYTYNFWRPVTAIRFAGDSSINPATVSDPTWTPLIVTPNFPSYMSAHSTVSSAAADGPDVPVRLALRVHRRLGWPAGRHPVVQQLRRRRGGSGPEPDLRRDPLPVRQPVRARHGPGPGSVRLPEPAQSQSARGSRPGPSTRGSRRGRFSRLVGRAGGRRAVGRLRSRRGSTRQAAVPVGYAAYAASDRGRRCAHKCR